MLPSSKTPRRLTESPLVLTDAVFDDGLTGHSVVFTYLLCVTPTAYWLEYADWWNPVMKAPLDIERGMTSVTGTIGSGVDWNEAAVQKFSV